MKSLWSRLYLLGDPEVNHHPLDGPSYHFHKDAGRMPVHHGALFRLGEDVRVVEVEGGVVEEDGLPVSRFLQPQYPDAVVEPVAPKRFALNHNALLLGRQKRLPLVVPKLPLDEHPHTVY
jgi:hypothetical protein